MFTATEILRLVEQGELSMNDTAHVQPLIDQSLERLNQTSLLKLGFNPEVRRSILAVRSVALLYHQVANITIKHLLSMQSGIYDLPEQLRDWSVLPAGHELSDWFCLQGKMHALVMTSDRLSC